MQIIHTFMSEWVFPHCEEIWCEWRRSFPLSGTQSNQLLLKESLVLSKIHLTQYVFLFTIRNQHNMRLCCQIWSNVWQNLKIAGLWKAAEVEEGFLLMWEFLCSISSVYTPGWIFCSRDTHVIKMCCRHLCEGNGYRLLLMQRLFSE